MWPILYEIALNYMHIGCHKCPCTCLLGKGQFKYYVIKEVGWWGQKMAIFDDLQYCRLSKSWVGGPKKVKNMMT